MKRIYLTLFLCACLLFLPACGSGSKTGPSGGTSETPAASVTAPIPATETESTPETDPPSDGFDAVRASKELWLHYGLSAYLANREAPDLTDFFADHANLSWLTLYADSFAVDARKATPVAEAFFRFVADTYGKEALTDISRRVEFKNAYLASLGMDIAYPQLPEVEETLARMTLSSDKDFPYVLTLDNASYYFKNFALGTATQYRGMIYQNTVGLESMIAYLKETLPNARLNTDQTFRFYMTFDGTGLSFTLPDGRMSINDSYSMLHESLHAMGIHSQRSEYLWLSEGLCNYFGKLLGFNRQYAAANIQILSAIAAGAYEDQAQNGDATAVFYTRLYHAYTEAGGKVSTVDEPDLILLNDLWAVLERSVTGYPFVTIGKAYEMLDGKAYNAAGMELTYAEATSLVCYLVETYGLDTVINAYETQDIQGTFGKSYEELVSLWMESLPVAAVPLCQTAYESAEKAPDIRHFIP